MLFIICSLCFYNCFIICYLDRMNNHNETPCKKSSHRILQCRTIRLYLSYFHVQICQKNTVFDPLHSFINEMTFPAPPNQFAQPIQPKLLLMHWYALIFLAAFLKITDLFIVLMPQINVLILCFYFL